MKNLFGCGCAEKWRDEAYLMLRVVTGLAFFYHGYAKVVTMGLDNVVGFFEKVGIPFPTVCAYLVSYGELLGGLALMLGFLTHWVAKINVLIMLGAIGFVHWGAQGGWLNGYGADGGYEYQLLLLAVSLFFMTAGAGKYSLDARCKKTSCAVEA